MTAFAQNTTSGVLELPEREPSSGRGPTDGPPARARATVADFAIWVTACPPSRRLAPTVRLPKRPAPTTLHHRSHEVRNVRQGLAYPDAISTTTLQVGPMTQA